MRINYKIGFVIFGFSLLITAAIIGGFFILRNNFSMLNIGESLGSQIVVTSELKGNESMQENLSAFNVESISGKALDDTYLNGLLKFLPSIILAVCTVIIGLTLLLWLILRKIYSNQMLSIIHDLKFIENSSKKNIQDETVAKAFEQLKEKFDGNLDDYKRLSSYLTHEQKNAIAILRTNLELEEKETGNIQILDRLTDSIDDILTLSNNTNNQVSETVDVSLVCAEVCDTYRKSYPAINFQFDETETTLIYGKDRWIYRAVSNLVDNAVKYGENKAIDVSVAKKKGSVIVKIKDQGKGIDPAVQADIFNHKYRINGLKQDGYGIGLSVVSHVCDLCQGFVYVDSEKELGSIFYLTFPSL